ncbi:hypothetical protein JD844_021037 [Phrynosoma platyrhinos]|uniref:nucleoside diphosphate phosphatase n=1 Tax=Phrynosoma platyrhinos TaxID=52577 RepID=A0ABQ7ST35_PHRPL|nr:hypothetical protein JD844_021037 [Phrynosoma platyrhinos]
MALSWITVLAIFALSSIYCILSHPNPELWFQDLFPLKVCPANANEKTFYGIMFDAGSTGTRIHIYTFIQRSPEKPAELEGEIFESVKPGLSAYAAEPEKGAETVRQLLDMAKEAVPPSHWKKTPVVLKATAGLRLLAEHKAQALLSKVRAVFEESPFLVPDDSVSVMDGTYEGILAWITVNFLTGQLYGRNQQTETLEQSPVDFFTSFQMFNSTYKLYTHSYLGFGLKAARLATLGALDMEEFHNVFILTGETGFEPCYSEVLKVVQGKLHQPEEIQRSTFYAFSYYYDRAADTDLIEYEKGGVLQVRDFERKAKEVCDNLDSYSSASPFLCMDLSYITALLKEGFGFGENTILQLAKKVNNIETSWALGATFHLLQSLGLSH